ncbi:unnamed protein product [Caenorhabditis brenneri]
MLLALASILHLTFLTSTSISPVPCSFLAYPYTSNSTIRDYHYYGECCTQEAVEYLDKNYPEWKKAEGSFRWMYIMPPKRKGLCGNSTEFVTTLNCYSLDPDCCNEEAVGYLDATDKDWRTKNDTGVNTVLKEQGYCNNSTTSAPLNCYYLPENCCNPIAVGWLNSKIKTWSKNTDEAWQARLIRNITTEGYCPNATGWRSRESSWVTYVTELNNQGYCSSETTVVTTTTPSTTTTIFNCYWLANSIAYPSYNYLGTCCNNESVSYLDEVYGPVWHNASDLTGKPYVIALKSNGICPGSTTTSTTGTTTEPLDCHFLPEACCNVVALTWLHDYVPNWTNRTKQSSQDNLVLNITAEGLCGVSRSSSTEGTSTLVLTEIADSVEYLDQNYPGWRQNESNLQFYLMELNQEGYCTVSSTTTVSTTTEPFNCYWLSTPDLSNDNYDGECCTVKSVQYLNAVYGTTWDTANSTQRYSYILNLKMQGTCLNLTTTTSTSTVVTSTSTPATTLPLNCFWLDQPSSSIFSNYKGECCNYESVVYLNSTHGSAWINASIFWKPTYTNDLKSSGVCPATTSSAPITSTSTPVTTTTTTTNTTSTTAPTTTNTGSSTAKTLPSSTIAPNTTDSPSTTTTSSTTSTTGFNCYWLDTIVYSKNLTTSTCCNQESVKYLNEVNGTDWQTATSGLSQMRYIADLRNNGICPINATTTTTSMVTTTAMENTGK